MVVPPLLLINDLPPSTHQALIRPASFTNPTQQFHQTPLAMLSTAMGPPCASPERPERPRMPPPGPCEPAAQELPGRQQLPHRLLLRQRPRHPTAAGDLAKASGERRPVPFSRGVLGLHIQNLLGRNG